MTGDVCNGENKGEQGEWQGIMNKKEKRIKRHGYTEPVVSNFLTPRL